MDIHLTSPLSPVGYCFFFPFFRPYPSPPTRVLTMGYWCGQLGCSPILGDSLSFCLYNLCLFAVCPFAFVIHFLFGFSKGLLRTAAPPLDCWDHFRISTRFRIDIPFAASVFLFAAVFLRCELLANQANYFPAFLNAKWRISRVPPPNRLPFPVAHPGSLEISLPLAGLSMTGLLSFPIFGLC